MSKTTSRLKSIFVGQSRNIYDPGLFHKLSLIAFFAWVGLGADGISSSCYGPEEAFLNLNGHVSLSIFVALATIFTIFIISTSYRQIVELFPTGGGGYLVASKLLSPTLGMISGSALLVDYVLTITLSIASGTDAIFSFLPVAWFKYRIILAVGGVLILTWLNIRGVKESIMVLVPVFLAFMLTHTFVILYSLIFHVTDLPAVTGRITQGFNETSQQLGTVGALLLIFKAYSMGAGTYTGIEAVSNGVPLLREPKVHTAKRVMSLMAISLSFMAGGLIIAYLLFNVQPVPGRTLNAILLDAITHGWGWGGSIFVTITLISEALLLFVASQTGFLDGPRILSNMALDRWMPVRFSSLNDRLVTQNGVIIMGLAALILMVFSGGSVRFLVVLYSINVFMTFSLSQLGMVRHWWAARKQEKGWIGKLLINGIGLVITILILLSVAIIKFFDGGWLTILITGSLILLSITIKNKYKKTGKLLTRLNSLVDVVQSEMREVEHDPVKIAQAKALVPDNQAKTAVLFVDGFSGLGLHSLLGINRLFSQLFKNFIFIQIGIVDSGVFKGKEELDDLHQHIKQETDKYVNYMRLHGYYAEAYSAVGVDIVNESVEVAKKVYEKYPKAIFFAGQLVFTKETFFSRWFYNSSAFSIQRQLYNNSMPIVILPIRVDYDVA